MIAIIDYGLGNLHSVQAALTHIGHPSVISRDIQTLRDADKLILPGVGAFGDGMRNLREFGIIEPLKEMVLSEKKLLLGICLGAQLLLDESFEFGHHEGLGFIKGSVRKISSQDPSIRVPHVGWNALTQVKESRLFKDIPSDALMYYVHSFYIDCVDRGDIAGVCTHGVEFASVVEHGNILGTQFHPEKSQLYGLQLLKNFVSMTAHG